MKLSKRTIVIAAVVCGIVIVGVILLKKKEGMSIPTESHSTLGKINDQPLYNLTSCKNCHLYPYITSKDCEACAKKGMLHKGPKDIVKWNTGFPYAAYVGYEMVENYTHEHSSELERCDSTRSVRPHRV